MNFDNLPVPIFSVRVKRAVGTFADLMNAKQSSLPVKVVSPCPKPGEFDLLLPSEVVSIRPVDDSKTSSLNNEIINGRAMLSQITNLAEDGSVDLQIAFFAGQTVEMGDVEIGIDEKSQKSYGRINQRELAGEVLYKELEKKCCFESAGECFFLMTTGPAIEDDIQLDFDDTKSVFQDSPVVQPTQPTITNSVCITGEDIRFVTTATQLLDGSHIFVASKMTKCTQTSDKVIRLAKGKLHFADWTKTGKIQIMAQAQLKKLTAEESSYLRKWDEFGDIEGEILLKQTREIGLIEYCNAKQNKDGTVSVQLSEASNEAIRLLESNGLDEVERVSDSPIYLQNPELTFSEFSKHLATEAKPGNAKLDWASIQSLPPVELAAESSSRNEKSNHSYYRVRKYDSTSRTLTLAVESIPASGALIQSLQGEITQIRRRMEARRKILEGRSANPQLGLLIEENGQPTSFNSPQKTKPLSAFVREKVFKNPPTVMQEKAIEVALNTPDIALIQGPPGTGKTTVIAAILERLNEIATQGGRSIKGQVLLTGFQHDAVENMIDRISLNGIPVPKFGKRSGIEEDDLDAFEKHLEDWCKDIADNLRKRNPQIADVEGEEQIRDLALQYHRTPSRKLATDLAREIASLKVSVIGEDLAGKATIIAKRLSTEELLSTSNNIYLNAARRIRIRPNSFADDGPERAEDAIIDLADILGKDEKAILDKASLWDNARGMPPFLPELKALKKSLMLRLTTPPEFRVERKNDDVVALAEEALEKIRLRGATAKDRKTAALVAFLSELENNPYGMIDAVSEFSFAFAATCQQSVGMRMQEKKGIRKGSNNQRMEYEYVIVDEAARVSPRDLMIPMSQGKHIILVGDHRQLPHIIDEEVAKQMEAGDLNIDENEWLKKSLFQYMFSERLKALEKTDNIQRRVTLDKQFRMHPRLGEFISRNFYERFDQSEKFESGLPAELFSHNLPGTNNEAAIWLDVPIEKGSHRRHGTSWTRPAEADMISDKLSEWMQSEEGSKLTYGIISFYKAQADLIKAQLENIAEDEKRLRIGTVDSFQGMEFDVVFLSVVRTIPMNWKLQSDDPQKQARSLFGHLCLYNRLNVSMSRQKKLLVVVGDANLIDNDLAREYVPGLVDFYKICQGPQSQSFSDGLFNRIMETIWQ